MEEEASRATPTRACAASMPCMMSFRKDYPRHGSHVRGWTPALHEYLGDRLAAPKWPQCLVFMDALSRVTPTSCCVKLGERLLPELNDAMHPSRTFRAKCPSYTARDPTLCTVVASASAVEKVLVEALVTSARPATCVVHHPTRVDP
jgi:hypothetical protein